MTSYKHNGWQYNVIDIGTAKTPLLKVYRTRGTKQVYLHFRDVQLVSLACDGAEEQRDIIENYFTTKFN